MDPVTIIKQLVNHLEAVCESAANWGAMLEETEGEHNAANARVASARRYIEEVNLYCGKLGARCSGTP